MKSFIHKDRYTFGEWVIHPIHANCYIIHEIEDKHPFGIIVVKGDKHCERTWGDNLLTIISTPLENFVRSGEFVLTLNSKVKEGHK